MIDQLEHSVSIAAEKCNSIVSEFTMCPIILDSRGSVGHHHWLFEFETPPNDQLIFNQLLDKELQNINIDYKAKRKQGNPIGYPKISIVKKGTFYQWMKQNNKLGGQNKVPRVQKNDLQINKILELDLHN